MEKKVVIKWLAGIVARGVAWFFAVKLGMEAAEASTAAAALMEGLLAAALAGLSVWTSVKGRRTLEKAPAK